MTANVEELFDDFVSTSQFGINNGNGANGKHEKSKSEKNHSLLNQTLKTAFHDCTNVDTEYESVNTNLVNSISTRGTNFGEGNKATMTPTPAGVSINTKIPLDTRKFEYGWFKEYLLPNTECADDWLNLLTFENYYEYGNDIALRQDITNIDLWQMTPLIASEGKINHKSNNNNNTSDSDKNDNDVFKEMNNVFLSKLIQLHYKWVLKS